MSINHSNQQPGKGYATYENRSYGQNYRSGVNNGSAAKGGNFGHYGFNQGGSDNFQRSNGGMGGGYKGYQGYRTEGAGYSTSRGGIGVAANGFFNRAGGNNRYGNDAHGDSHYHREEKPEEEIFKEHTPGINFDLYDAIRVTITPNDTEPAESFAAMNLAPALNDNVTRCRYTKPTPVQRYGIPCVLKGSDMMACAQTGSGKTAAYLIPAINFMLVSNMYRSQQGTGQASPGALILAPTRELSIQIYEEGRKFTFRSGIRCVVVYGGADPRHQIHELSRGCGLLVATPGRLLDLYSRGYVRFSSIRFLVLDEADRMLDMGFEPQIRQIVQGPESDMPRVGQRQTLLYSATFPKEIQQLAREFLHRHYFLQVGRVGSTTESITQDVRWVEDNEKRETLLNLLNQHGGKRILVFVEKKRDADYLERFLRYNRLACTSIHGDRVQQEREEALNSFKTGDCRVLVATDVASRGLDIPNVALVVQYDLPSNIDDYVHRIGRTGRAGKQGTAISFFNDKNRNIVDDLITLLRETNQNIPPQIQALAKKAKNTSINHNSFGRGRGGGGGMRGRFGSIGNNYPFPQHGYNRGAGSAGGGGTGAGFYRGRESYKDYGSYPGGSYRPTNRSAYPNNNVDGGAFSNGNMGGDGSYSMRNDVFGQRTQ